ncbi:MAG: phage head-tail connector protein [Butyrivibrio sp.]|nr:phage head-tail connector protein [Butyrivibrio sp.]
MDELLGMLKVDLGIKATTAYDERLEQYIEAAKKSIAEEGITLDLEDIQDCQIVVMYAAWTWRKRDSGEGMPRMLRYALNNRVFREKIRNG